MADFVDKISDAANGTWDDLSDPETWTKIQEAINEAGGDALEWSEEAWVLTQAGVDCLKNATNTDLTQNITQGILDCRIQLGGDEFNNSWSDFKDKISKAAQSAWDNLSDPETWNKVQEAINEAGGDALDWSMEAWVSSKEGVDCLKNATNTDINQNATQAVLDCRTQLLGSGANVATFNIFLGAGIAVLILVRAA